MTATMVVVTTSLYFTKKIFCAQGIFFFINENMVKYI